jgi:hypothetical protein
MVIFIFGFVMVYGFVSAFNAQVDSINQYVKEKEAERIVEYVKSAICRVYVLGKITRSDITAFVEIPRSIRGSNYAFYLAEDRRTIILDFFGSEYPINPYNIPVTMLAPISSDRGGIIIKFSYRDSMVYIY